MRSNAVRAAAKAAGRDPAELAFVLHTTAVVVDTPAAERKAIDRGKNLLALVSTLPGMDQVVRTEGFDVPALLDEVRATMGTRETLAAGGGFPALRRDGDLAATGADPGRSDSPSRRHRPAACRTGAIARP